jgi:Fe-S oxidoreductase
MIEDLRGLAAKHVGLLAAHKALLDNVKKTHNPYGEPHHARGLAKEHSLPESAETVYFVGCTANYRERAIRDATISVLKKAEVDFTVVDEYCCGSPLLRIGQPDAAKALAAHNLKKFDDVGAKRIVTSCAGCFRALRMDYPRLGLNARVEVVHAAQLVDELLRNGVLEAKTTTKGVVTYHDPCHLGRHMEVYEPPRRVLQALQVQLEEMPRTRANAWCCGAGGGAKSAFPEWSQQVAEQRVAEAVDTGADLLVSTCPFCKRALNDGRGKARRGLRVLDLLEFVDQLT